MVEVGLVQALAQAAVVGDGGLAQAQERGLTVITSGPWTAGAVATLTAAAPALARLG